MLLIIIIIIITSSSSIITLFHQRVPLFQITLSGSASVPENQPRGTKIGSFSTVDPNTKDKHTYSIVSGGSGKFELRGPDLFTLTTFNYETAPNR